MERAVALEAEVGAGPARSSDEAIAWPELVGVVRRTVRRLAGPGGETDDLVQATLEQVVRSLDRFEGRAAMSTFVYRITAHVVMNEWRSWRRWLRRFRLGLGGVDAQADPCVDAEASLRARETSARVARMLEALDPKSRMVLVLCDMEELPASSVAEILGIPEPTVRSRLRVAREKLALRVRQDPYFREELER